MYLFYSKRRIIPRWNQRLGFSAGNTESPTSNDHQFYFDQLIINNKVIQPGDESHILSQTMPYTESIKLAHNQNSLILEVATSNYTQNKYKYEYQLEGFDRTWLPLHSPKIVYTNLDPGHYKLTVREKNDSQTICGERSLHIYIRPLSMPISMPIYYIY